jgi:DMSO/TMAO reductase YedYZ heme-binding membrane subunit
MKKFSYTPLQIAMHIYAWSGIAFLLFDFFTGNLSANPIQDLERRTGRHAITLLVLLLLCTPINTLFKWSEPLKRRRALGLYTFMYAAIHVIIFADLDYGLAWSRLIREVVEKPRLIVGMLAITLLIPLAITFFGKNASAKIGNDCTRSSTLLDHWLCFITYGVKKATSFLYKGRFSSH